MSELSKKVAQAHFNYGRKRCRCGANIATGDHHVTVGDFARHLTETMEVAAREGMETDLQELPASPLHPTHFDIHSPGGAAYMAGVAAGLEVARLIAKGES